MASDDSHISNKTLLTNVRVKIEPGTSTSEQSVPSPENPVSLLRNIKMEPGISSSTQRLTSFRVPRDLTLGGNKTEKPKKVYTPNINAQRNKKKNETVSVKNEPTKSMDRESRSRGRGRERSKGDRGRGKRQLIESVGVWSEGINIPITSKRHGESSNDNTESRKFLAKPKLNIDKPIDKVKEQQVLKELLGDDSADDDSHNVDSEFVTLPLKKEEIWHKNEIKLEAKTNTYVYDNEADVDRKPVISEDGKVISVKQEHELKVEIPDVQKKKLAQVSEIIEKSNNSYILIQFPNCLPSLESEKEKEKEKPKSELLKKKDFESKDSESKDSKSKSSKSKSFEIKDSESKDFESNSESKDPKSNTYSDNDSKTKDKYCTLNSLITGYVGKLQILKSGKTKLCLGANNLIVDVGMRSTFRQDLLVARLKEQKESEKLKPLSGEIINLGSVNDTLMVSSDLEAMMMLL